MWLPAELLLLLWRIQLEYYKKEKEQLDKKNTSQQQYIAKLENRLDSGVSDKGLIDENAKLKETIQQLRKEKQKSDEHVKHQESQVRELTHELSVLSTALEVRIEELSSQAELSKSPYSDQPNYTQYGQHSETIRNSLLYELASWREAARAAEHGVYERDRKF